MLPGLIHAASLVHAARHALADHNTRPMPGTERGHRVTTIAARLARLHAERNHVTPGYEIPASSGIGDYPVVNVPVPVVVSPPMHPVMLEAPHTMLPHAVKPHVVAPPTYMQEVARLFRELMK